MPAGLPAKPSTGTSGGKAPKPACGATTAQAQDIHASAHYQWEGASPYQFDGPLLQGKKQSAVNSYCINILGNWGGCGNCHVGLGKSPARPRRLRHDLANIDCLICHQEKYKRVKAQGRVRPGYGEHDHHDGPGGPDGAQADARTCLQCHAKGGGGDAYKRGDLALAHGTTSDRAFDVHMAKTGANLPCQKCHTVSEHRIAGAGRTSARRTSTSP